jgi:hypothetical protein
VESGECRKRNYRFVVKIPHATLSTINFPLSTKKVGDVSPKHHIGESRLAPVFGRKSNSKPLGNTNGRPKTEAVIFRLNITHQTDVGDSRLAPCLPKVVSKVGDVSPKGCLPEKKRKFHRSYYQLFKKVVETVYSYYGTSIGNSTTNVDP